MTDTASRMHAYRGVAALAAFAKTPAGQRLEEEAEEVAERYAPQIESALAQTERYVGAQLSRAGSYLEQQAKRFTGLGKNTDKILDGAKGAQYRVPDFLVKVGGKIKEIGEVKDTAKLYSSRQLGDLMTAAENSEAKFSLYLGERTQLTKNLAKQLYESGAYVYRYIDGRFVNITQSLNPR